MKHYIELSLMDSSDFSLYELWSKLYTQLHLAFVERQDEQEKIPYGVSFPQYRINEQKNTGFLGSKIRVFSNTQDELQQLDLATWLARLTDYVHITNAREVPQAKVTAYANYYRIRQKDSVAHRIQHQAARRNISVDEAAKHFQGYVERVLGEPFVSLKSLSSEHTFKIHIAKRLVDEASHEKFGTYGLSKTATVPEF